MQKNINIKNIVRCRDEIRESVEKSKEAKWFEIYCVCYVKIWNWLNKKWEHTLENKTKKIDIIVIRWKKEWRGVREM